MQQLLITVTISNVNQRLVTYTMLNKRPLTFIRQKGKSVRRESMYKKNHNKDADKASK